MANPSATFSTGVGYFDWSTNQRSIIDDDYENYVDYDDKTRFDLSAFVMTKAASEQVDTPEFYAWAGELTPRSTTVTASVTAGDAVITVASASGIRKFEVLFSPVEDAVGELFRVTSKSGLDLTVTRLNTTPGAVASGGAIYALGEAVGTQEATSAEDNYMVPAKVTNRVMILRRAWKLSVTEMASALRLAISAAALKADQARKDFTKDMAHLLWFSVSNLVSSDVFTSKGINEQLAGNSSTFRINAGGPLAYADFSDLTEALAPFSQTREYMCFHGTTAMGSFADLGTTATVANLRPEDSAYGFAGRSILVNDFRFNLKFERVFAEVGAPFDKYIFVLDLSAIKCYHLRGKKFQYQANIHADPGGEIRKSQYRAQIGLGITWPKRHGYIYGVT